MNVMIIKVFKWLSAKTVNSKEAYKILCVFIIISTDNEIFKIGTNSCKERKCSK